MRLSQRHEAFLFSLLMSIGLSVVVTAAGVGLQLASGRLAAFWGPFAEGLLVGVVVGTPTAMLLVPRVRAVVAAAINDR
jgi:hypothetical protein